MVTGGGGRMTYPSVSYVRTGGYRLPENFAAGPKINLGTIAGGVGQIRKEFPEAWIWTSLVAKYDWHAYSVSLSKSGMDIISLFHLYLFFNAPNFGNV